MLPVCASIGVILTIVVTIVFRTTSLDIDLQGLAYRHTEPHWPYTAHAFWRALHDFGTIPGILLALGAIVVATGSFLEPRLRRWRFPAFYIVALTAVGPGFVTNILGKIFAGRPRPEEIVEFGGTLPFLEPFEFGTPGKGFSFLCGHCSMGYLFFAFFFLLSGWRRWAAIPAAALFGTLIGAGRVVQAAHFPSDVLLDGTLMFTVAAILAPLSRLQPSEARRIPRYRVVLIGTLTAITFAVLALFSTPIHKERIHTWVAERFRRAETHETLHRWNSATRTILISAERGDLTVRFERRREPLSIRSSVKGFGFPGAGSEAEIASHGASLSYRHRLTGAYWEVHARFEVVLADTIDDLVITTGDGAVSVDRRGLTRPVRITVNKRVQSRI